MDRTVESAADAAWRVARAELAALVDRLAPTGAITVLRHTIAACDTGDLVIARVLSHVRAVVDQHGEQQQQRGDAVRWFTISGVLRADGRTVWVADTMHILADELIVGDAACVEVAERVRSRYEMTYHDPATSWMWLMIDEQGSSAHYEIGARPPGRQTVSAL